WGSSDASGCLAWIRFCCQTLSNHISTNLEYLLLGEWELSITFQSLCGGERSCISDSIAIFAHRYGTTALFSALSPITRTANREHSCWDYPVRTSLRIHHRNGD